jgi:hypothetical protein
MAVKTKLPLHILLQIGNKTLEDLFAFINEANGLENLTEAIINAQREHLNARMELVAAEGGYSCLVYHKYQTTGHS